MRGEDGLHASQRSGAAWQAELDLGLIRRGADTVLLRNHHRGPLQVQKALYPEGRDTCHVAILHPPGGLVAGDDLTIRADLGTAAHAVMTTPGATKWYRSEGSLARQALHFSVADGAVLEWLPRENIFFDGSNIAMTADVDLGAEATYFGWDIFSFGRRASGESWNQGHLELRTRIRRAGRVLWSEIANVDARSGFARSAVGLSGKTVCGTFLWAGISATPSLVTRCRDVAASTRDCRVGVTAVPGVLVARYLGNSTEDAFRWFTNLWAVLREASLRRAAFPPRVWAC